MFTIIFVAVFLGLGMLMVVILTSMAMWQHHARAAELEHCANHPQVTLSACWLLESPSHHSA